MSMPARASAFDRNQCSIPPKDSDAIAGIAMPARASASDSTDTLMNAELLAGFVPKNP